MTIGKNVSRFKGIYYAKIIYDENRTKLWVNIIFLSKFF